MENPILEVRSIEKSFGGIHALRGVTFDLMPGECLALVGENGAGKSTLMKILSGVWPAGTFSGEFKIQGRPARLSNTLDGRRAGISIIHQELCLFPKMTVAENLFLSEEAPYTGNPSADLWSLVRWDELKERAETLLAELGFEVSADAVVEDLSIASKQLVEIARAVHHRSRILILDEPTSALAKKEISALFEILEGLKRRGLSLIYISHKMDEVLKLARRIVVLRDGQSVAELDAKDQTEQSVIAHMVGRPLTLAARTSHATDVVQLAVRDWSHRTDDGKDCLTGISFSVHRGEILGVAGLMGAGRSELLRSLLGVLPGEKSGELHLCGRPFRFDGAGDAIEQGVGFVPEERKRDGLFLAHSVGFNASIEVLRQFVSRFLLLNLPAERAAVEEKIQDLRIKCQGPDTVVRQLSGGNQQKVLLARVLASEPKVLFLDEPTRGIDVGAKEEIYSLIRELAAKGLAVVMVSSELPEILSLSDRILVMRGGKISASLQNHPELTQSTIMQFAAGDCGGETQRAEG